MANDPERVKLERIDWSAAFPFVRLFQAFRLAIWPPGKLLVALLLIALLWVGGVVMDAVAGRSVLPGEIPAYIVNDSEAFDAWLERQQEREIPNRLYNLAADLPRPGEESWSEIVKTPERFRTIREAVDKRFDTLAADLTKSYDEAAPRREAAEPDVAKAMEDEYKTARARIETQRRERLAMLAQLENTGVFATALDFKLDAFERMIRAAISLNFGFSDLASPAPLHPETVLGALRDLAIVLPGWLFHRHPIYLIVWCLFAMALWSLFGGAISRMVAMHATLGEPATAGRALGFARKRWFWFFITPWVPLVIAGLFGLGIALVGALFNVMLLDIFAGAGFGVLLFLGFLIAMAMIFVAVGSGLFYPAIAVEGTDSFDALSRSGNYVFGRFWHWLFYSIVALVYGAVTYLILGSIVFLTISVTRFFAGAWVVSQTEDQRNVFDVMLPEPQIGELRNAVDWSSLDATSMAAAGLMSVWIYLLIALLAAFAISYYFSAHTLIYLLLRRSADGTELDEVYLEDAPPSEPREPAVPEKVEESAQG